MSDAPPFFVELVDRADYPVWVFGSGLARPDEWLPELENHLVDTGVRAPVLLDLLMCNGAGRQRYFTAQAREHGALIDYWRVDVTDEIATCSAQLLSRHLCALDMRLLSAEVQQAVRDGVPITQAFLNYLPPE